jgi:hypothetical protein
MDRNSVIVDGTLPGSAPCSTSPAVQDLGPLGPTRTPLGRNGILVWKANNTWVENMTVCNFLGGGGNAGNEVWWNGGDGGGQIDLSGFWGNYLNATSTYYAGESTAAAYGVFASERATAPSWQSTCIRRPARPDSRALRPSSTFPRSRPTRATPRRTRR